MRDLAAQEDMCLVKKPVVLSTNLRLLSHQQLWLILHKLDLQSQS